MPISKQTLIDDGFTGFSSFRGLDLDRIPPAPGIYAVLKPEAFEARFLAASVGGRFKQRDPSVSGEVLAANWVDGAEILYVGKAGPGSRGNRGLRKRIREFADFSTGKPVGHWGGRLLWQLADSQSLVIAWKEFPAEVVNATEARYQADFRRIHGRLPFANLVQAGTSGL